MRANSCIDNGGVSIRTTPLLLQVLPAGAAHPMVQGPLAAEQEGKEHLHPSVQGGNTYVSAIRQIKALILLQ